MKHFLRGLMILTALGMAQCGNAQTTNPPGVAPLGGAPPATQFPIIVDQNGNVTYPTTNLTFKGLYLWPGFTTVQAWGAKGGTNDDTAAVSNAVNSGASLVFVPPITNYTWRTIYLSNNVTLWGERTLVAQPAGATGYMIDVTTATNWSIHGFTLDGSMPANTNVLYWQGTKGTNSGLHLLSQNSGGGSLEEVSCFNFTDAGFRCDGTFTIGEALRRPSLHFKDCKSIGNYYGFHFISADTSHNSEYSVITGLEAHNNFYNVQVSAGNLAFQGCAFNGGNYGANVGNNNDGDSVGNNGAHGKFDGCNFNHSMYVNCSGFGNGELFNNCQFLAVGGILLSNCSGVVFQGGTFNPAYLVSTGSSNCIVRFNEFTTTNFCATTNSDGTEFDGVNGNQVAFNRQLDGGATDNKRLTVLQQEWSVYKTNTFVTNTVTTAFDDPELKIGNVQAGHTYEIRVMLLFTNSTATPGFSGTMVTPARTAGTILIEHANGFGGSPVCQIYPYHGGDWPGSGFLDQVNGTFQSGFMRFTAMCRFSAAGTVKVQWAQFASSGSSTALLAGSRIFMKMLD